MASLLVTGAAGFIGSNFVRMLREGGARRHVVALDALTYAGNLANLTGALGGEFVFVKADICDEAAIGRVIADHGVDEIAHFAAESHVDRSIMGSGPFVRTNVLGTQVLLDHARAAKVRRFLMVSTDEVYGTLPEDKPDVKFTEDTPLAPNSPYSASKAASDCLVRSYFHTFHMPVLTTRCSNNYGPYQFPEKLIPLFVTNLLEGKKVPLYGDGMNIRDWLHVRDHCEALLAVLDRGRDGEVYNIGGDNELTNRTITESILREMNKPWDEFVTYVKDRPGHDRRYAIDASKIRRELGWSPRHRWPAALRDTIAWYTDNRAWWEAIKSGAYRDFYASQYGA
jgi:dTDP-glucose 4,6-dehydratase